VLQAMVANAAINANPIISEYAVEKSDHFRICC
jgi:hypothetical protein